MRHKKKGNHLGRTTSHKKALMKNMAAQIIEHKEIKTTVAKAKELRGYVERLITYGKKGTLHHRRLAFQLLQNKEAVTGLFDEVAPTFETRDGGYTRIIKLGNRRGDGAPMSILQLVGFEKSASKSKPKTKKSGKKKETKEEEKAPEAAAAVEEKPEVKETEPVEEVKEIQQEPEEHSSEEQQKEEEPKKE
jgi:large subunit ribosomal protein L17